MSRNRINSRKEQPGLWGKLLRTTFLLALVFSAGLIIGKRIGSGDSFVPLVAVAAKPAAPEVMEVIDTGEEHLGTDYSFYELLNTHDRKKEELENRSAQPKQLAADKPVADKQAPDKRTDEPHPASAEKPADAPADVSPSKPAPEVKKVVVNAATDDAAPKNLKPEVKKGVESIPKADVAEPKYTLQIGSHSSKTDAQDELKSLAKMGVKPYLIEVDVPNRGTFYRVRVGKYASLADARKAQSQLQSNQKIASFVSPL